MVLCAGESLVQSTKEAQQIRRVWTGDDVIR